MVLVLKVVILENLIGTLAVLEREQTLVRFGNQLKGVLGVWIGFAASIRRRTVCSVWSPSPSRFWKLSGKKKVTDIARIVFTDLFFFGKTCMWELASFRFIDPA